MLIAAVLTTLALAPQGGPTADLPSELRPRLDYPALVAPAEFAPFVDAQGDPARTGTRAVDTADFDGDGNVETWFLAADGGLSVQMPHTADLGRFVPYGGLPPSGCVAGATYRSSTSPTDFALLIDPGSAALSALFYVPPVGGSPRRGSWVLQPMVWIPGTDGYELQTADHDGDGHDDIMALLEDRNGNQVIGTTITKLRMGTSRGYLDHESTVQVSVPAVCEKLRMLDLDGDGRSDFVVHVPGLGVVSYVDDGHGGFALRDFVPLDQGLLRDLFAGDADGDGRDDFGLVLDAGALLCRSRPAGLDYTALLAPAGTGVLAAARVVDASGVGDPDIVAFPRDGRGFVIWEDDAARDWYDPPITQVSPVPTPPLGPQNPGVLGESALVADVDNDGALDVVLQRPDGAHWITLHGPAGSLMPTTVRVENLGPLGSVGFELERFTVFLPQEFFARGLTEVEVGVFLQDPFTHEQVYWHRVLLQPNPQTQSASFLVNVMTDARNLSFLFGPPRYTTHTNGGVTCGGPTVLTLHGKLGTKRFRSYTFQWDGDPHGNGSAVGVRWRVVAAPPLPSDEAQLLPWN